MSNRVEGRKFSVLSFVFAGLSWIVLPIVFGPLGLLFGMIGVLKDDVVMGSLGMVFSVLSAVGSWLVATYLLT